MSSVSFLLAVHDSGLPPQLLPVVRIILVAGAGQCDKRAHHVARPPLNLIDLPAEHRRLQSGHINTHGPLRNLIVPDRTRGVVPGVVFASSGNRPSSS